MTETTNPLIAALMEMGMAEAAEQAALEDSKLSAKTPHTVDEYADSFSSDHFERWFNEAFPETSEAFRELYVAALEKRITARETV